MRRLCMILLLLLCVGSVLGDSQRQLVTVSITVTYRSVTLDQAARIEARIRDENPDAWSVGFTIHNDSAQTSRYPWGDIPRGNWNPLK